LALRGLFRSTVAFDVGRRNSGQSRDFRTRITSLALRVSSTIGEASALKKLGIAPVADLHGVGRNLQDHVHVSGVISLYKGKFPDRPADSNAVEAEVNLSSGVDGHGTDIILVLEKLPNASPELAASFGALPENCFTISPSLVQPTSRGQVSLASADWRVRPTIEGNLLVAPVIENDGNF
jgi:choline dehydrogenase